jgi:hypothetical protein
MKSSFSVQRSVRNVEKGSFADETCGQVLHSVVRSTAIPNKNRSKLRAYAEFCLRKILIPNSASDLLLLFY